AIEASPHVLRILASATGGARWDQLVEVLRAEDETVTSETAADFVDTLVANQVLVSELGLPWTGVEPLDDLIERLVRLASYTPANRVGDTLQEVRQLLSKLKHEPPGSLIAC